MSLLIRNLVSNVFSKRISACSYIRNEIGVINAQYHILKSPTKNKSQNLKCIKNIQRENAILAQMGSAYKSLTTELKSLYNNGLEVLLLIGSSELKEIGYLWYKTLDEVKVEEFFTLFNMPDTFFSRFKVIELHVWMLLIVLPQDNRKQKHIRYALIQAMWHDNEVRAKMLHSFNKNFRKNMRDLYEKFKVSLIYYDKGFLENDMTLASSIWYNFFSKEDVDPRYLEALVKFIRHQIHHLDNLNLEQLGSVSDKTGIWLSVQPHVKEIFKKQ